jgi:signal peptidase I
MFPTFSHNDLILTKTNQKIRRRQIIIFKNPITLEIIIKRIVATGGDKVEISDGSVYLNGKSLNEEYIKKLPKTKDSEENGSWTIPQNHVFVLGDNRRVSTHDSRDLGFIRLNDHVNHYWCKIWPIRNHKVISNF